MSAPAPRAAAAAVGFDLALSLLLAGCAFWLGAEWMRTEAEQLLQRQQMDWEARAAHWYPDPAEDDPPADVAQFPQQRTAPAESAEDSP